MLYLLGGSQQPGSARLPTSSPPSTQQSLIDSSGVSHTPAKCQAQCQPWRLNLKPSPRFKETVEITDMKQQGEGTVYSDRKNDKEPGEPKEGSLSPLGSPGRAP